MRFYIAEVNLRMSFVHVYVYVRRKRRKLDRFIFGLLSNIFCRLLRFSVNLNDSLQTRTSNTSLLFQCLAHRPLRKLLLTVEGIESFPFLRAQRKRLLQGVNQGRDTRAHLKVLIELTTCEIA